MREIRLYGSEGGGAAALPTPIPIILSLTPLDLEGDGSKPKRGQNSRFVAHNRLIA